jgi:hypothetical protein
MRWCVMLYGMCMVCVYGMRVWYVVCVWMRVGVVRSAGGAWCGWRVACGVWRVVWRFVTLVEIPTYLLLHISLLQVFTNDVAHLFVCFPSLQLTLTTTIPTINYQKLKNNRGIEGRGERDRGIEG